MTRTLGSLIAACTFAVALSLTAAPAQAQRSDYLAKLAQYEAARAPYEREAQAYWDAVGAKRRVRMAKHRSGERIVLQDYVLTQPPVYDGPPRPVDPDAPTRPPAEREVIPTIDDFLAAAADQFGFVPDRPRTESEFKRAYAQSASAAGLTRDQIVGVYVFETGGNGTHDTQAGVSATRTRPISPAVGYNQLLSTNSAAILHSHGAHMVSMLQHKAKTLSGSQRQAMNRKIEALRRMIAYARTVPYQWSALDRLAKTTRGGWGLHAIVLDVDLGPFVQVQKLATSVQFAKTRRYTRTLTAAELELMNLTGDGNGIDMVVMPQAMRERVPTANFFQRNGYERNPVARRTAVVANLVSDMDAKMAKGAQQPGAKELAASF